MEDEDYYELIDINGDPKEWIVFDSETGEIYTLGCRYDFAEAYSPRGNPLFFITLSYPSMMFPSTTLKNPEI